MIKFCQHAVQNIFPVRILDGFVKLSQMYSCSSFLICCYNKHHEWSNLGEKSISSILQITLHYQEKSRLDLKIESNRDTRLTASPRLTFSYLAYIAQTHLPRDGTVHSVPCSTTSIINQQSPHRGAASPTFLSSASSCWGHRVDESRTG